METIREFVIRKVWREQPRWRGLNLMTLGFITSVMGAAVAFGGSLLRDAGVAWLGGIAAVPIVILGWGLLLSGVLGMLAGIIINFWIVLGGQSNSK